MYSKSSSIARTGTAVGKRRPTSGWHSTVLGPDHLHLADTFASVDELSIIWRKADQLSFCPAPVELHCSMPSIVSVPPAMDLPSLF